MAGDKEFPQELKGISPAVNRIFAYGNIELLNRKLIAVVGSRNSSEYGRKMVKEITEELVKNDIVIVSGMAVGIDAVAHEICILNGGQTIAVLGSGFKNIYPKENIGLFKKIIENDGLVLSEFPIDAPVQKKNFPLRNRIISALSKGVVVIEATYRSGTSTTARHAWNQGKKVFCVPNCVGSKNSKGIINLIKSGAIVIESGNDVLRELKLDVIDLNTQIKKKKYKNDNELLMKKLSNIGENAIRIFKLMKRNEALDCEEISQKINLDITNVNQVLTMMELEEIIENFQLNKYKLKDIYCE